MSLNTKYSAYSPTGMTVEGDGVIPIARLPAGIANGVASLNGSAQIPVAQIPGYVQFQHNDAPVGNNSPSMTWGSTVNSNCATPVA